MALTNDILVLEVIPKRIDMTIRMPAESVDKLLTFLSICEADIGKAEDKQYAQEAADYVSRVFFPLMSQLLEKVDQEYGLRRDSQGSELKG